MQTLISKSDKIFVAGHLGMAGSAICRSLISSGYTNITTVTRNILDLTDHLAVHQWFDRNRPDVVVLAAAKVGGISANASYPADFLLQNLKIQNNVIESSFNFSTRRFLFLGSSCIYPKHSSQPIREDSLLTGPLEPTNEAYALAKISGLKLCDSLRSQHGFDALSLMPTNLYGPGDNYHPSNSHVLPAMLRRFYEASQTGLKQVVCWGTGAPQRECLHVDDLGSAAVFCLQHWHPDLPSAPCADDGTPLTLLNVGTGVDVSILDLAQAIAKICNYTGDIVWDNSKPDGTPKKLLDVSRLSNLGWRAKITLSEGLASTLSSFKNELLSSKLRS